MMNCFSIAGLSPDSIDRIVKDEDTKLVIQDKGNGYIRHQLIRNGRYDHNFSQFCRKMLLGRFYVVKIILVEKTTILTKY
jgi:hypothetical protein